ncbi:2-oxoglutarate and fe-dependent oxygenase superfamily protein isoform 1, partial [Globisporangium splendens]
MGGKKEKKTAVATAAKSKKATGGKKYSDATRTAPTSSTKSTAAVLSPLLQFEPTRNVFKVTHLHEDLIYKVPQFFTKAECRQVMQFANQEGFARVTQRATREYAFRDNDRILLRLEMFADLLWQRMQRHVPAKYEGMYAVGLNPAIRFYRYGKGQRFGCHVDQSDVDPITGYHSRFTVLVYLNDSNDSDLSGGNTIFYANEAGAKHEEVVLSVAPETGAALVHGHGDKCLLHEGALVTSGEKYLLRTDVMYSRTPPREA